MPLTETEIERAKASFETRAVDSGLSIAKGEGGGYKTLATRHAYRWFMQGIAIGRRAGLADAALTARRMGNGKTSDKATALAHALEDKAEKECKRKYDRA